MRLGKDSSWRDSWSWRRLRGRSKSKKSSRLLRDRGLMMGKVVVDRDRIDSRTSSHRRNTTIISKRWTNIVFRDLETLNQEVYYLATRSPSLTMKIWWCESIGLLLTFQGRSYRIYEILSKKWGARVEDPTQLMLNKLKFKSTWRMMRRKKS